MWFAYIIFFLTLHQLGQPKGFRGESQIVAKGRYETYTSTVKLLSFYH